MDDWKVIALSDTKQNNVYQALKKIENPEDVGKILMFHIANNIEPEDRIAAIKSMLQGLTTNILPDELPKGELERILNIMKQI